jgi:hypothetical protein
MMRLDTNKDGKITEAEFMGMPIRKAIVESLAQQREEGRVCTSGAHRSALADRDVA